MWAFLLWKNTQNKANKNPGKPPDKDNSWIMYQKWCKLEQQDRETWITAGKNVQTFTKLSTTKIPLVAPNTNVSFNHNFYNYNKLFELFSSFRKGKLMKY